MMRRHTAGWGLPLDDGPLRPRPAGSLGSSVGRWWWPAVAVVGFLTVAGYVLAHADPRSGLSGRGWLALSLAAVLVMMLTIRRRSGPGPLARAMTEYAVVALLAVLLVTAGGAPQPASQQDQQRADVAQQDQRQRQRPAVRQAARQDQQADQARPDQDRPPGIVRVVTGVWGWLAQLWREAGEQVDRSAPPTTTAPPRRPGR
jgi:Flp pilus assembly pilin Flp